MTVLNFIQWLIGPPKQYPLTEFRRHLIKLRSKPSGMKWIDWIRYSYSHE